MKINMLKSLKLHFSCSLLLLVVYLSSVRGQWIDQPPKYDCPKDPRTLYPCNCTEGSDEGVYIECINTNLASLSVGLSQVRTRIHTLTISNCNMEKLYGDVFQKPLTIRILKIEDTPIKDISDGTFDGLIAQSLEELYITNTWLSRVPPSLQALTQLKILSITNSRIAFLPPGIFDGMVNLEELSISKAKVNDVGATTFQALKNLKKLSLDNNELKTMKHETFVSQVELEFLDLSHNNFSQLEPHFFQDLRKILWLNVSHNDLSRFESRTFARNSVLRVLHMDGNKLTRLDANSFRGMRFMRRLTFADNEINQVARGTFRSVARLGTIDLSRNKLKKVDFQMFADLRYIEVINVAENQITEVQTEAFQNLYQTSINLSYNALRELKEGAFINCENMTVLDLSHNQLNNIERLAMDQTTYAADLRLEYNQFTSMSQIPLEFQSGIMILNVSHNSIVDIPKKTFPKLYELHTIDFSYNNLSEIDKSVFTNLLSLRFLYFQHNNLTDLDSSTFGQLFTLFDLDLSYNQINKLGRGIFSGLASLRAIQLHHNRLTTVPTPPISLSHLYLSHNEIAEIDGRQPWPVMNSLLYIDLDNNMLGDSLERGKFSNLHVVGTLSLRNNNITRPPWEALEDLQSLQMLHLDGNRITNLTKNAFGRLPVVSHLGLSHNNINNISTEAFENLRQLITLDLSYNNLTYVQPGAFVNLVAVQSIDLSHNQIESLQNRTHGLFEDCLSIRTLNISHNRIPFVTPKMFPESRWVPYKLTHVDLSHNVMPVLTRDILIGTKHLKVLNISYNQLTDIRKDVINNLTSLDTLDLSGNALTDKIFEASKPFFAKSSNMTNVYLHSNKLTKLPVAELIEMKTLRKLDVRFNQLTQFHPEFNEQIKLGLDIELEGNPLVCDCQLRPVSYWLASIGRVQGRSGPWDRATCAEPSNLEGRSIGSLIEQQLICDDSEDAFKFRISPDVRFRDVKEERDRVELSWYVNTNEDVGNFRLELRSGGIPQTTLFKKELAYSDRHEVIRGLPGGQELTLCLLAETSTGRVRSWKQDQCRKVGPFSRASTLIKATSWNSALPSMFLLLLTFIWF